MMLPFSAFLLAVCAACGVRCCCRFGWGLSYTTFSYVWSDSGRAVDSSAIPTTQLATQGANYSVTVTNTGSVAGDAVVLAFINFRTRLLGAGACTARCRAFTATHPCAGYVLGLTPL